MTHPSHIKSITLANIRGYDCTIEVGHVNLAYGENEAGKTGLLNAISAALWGMIQTEFSGWTKDKGTIVASLVDDPKKPASVKLHHEDGTVSSWETKPKKDGGASISHNPSSCVEPRGKEDLVRKILGATSPSARAGARKRFVEVFDTGITEAALLTALHPSSIPMAKAAITDLSLGPAEMIEGLLGEFKANLKEIDESAPPAGAESVTEADLDDIDADLDARRERKDTLRDIVAAGEQYAAAQALGDITKTRADLKEAREQLDLHLSDLTEAKRVRDEALKALGWSDFDRICKEAAEAHAGHIDGSCHVCGAEAAKEDFDAIVAALAAREAELHEKKAALSAECIQIAADMEVWKREVARLEGVVDTMSRAASVPKPEIPLDAARAEQAEVEEEIVVLRTKRSEVRALLDAKARARDFVARKRPLEQAIEALVKLRDERFANIVGEFCGKISEALPDGWTFDISTDNGEFQPALIRDGRRVVDPTGAQAAILVSAMRTVSAADPIDVAGERDYSPAHLGLNLLGMTKAEGTQFFVQSTTLPDDVESLKKAGVVFIDVAKARKGK